MPDLTAKIVPEVIIILDGTTLKLVGDYMRVQHGQELKFSAVNTEAIVFLPLPDWFEDKVTENGTEHESSRKTERGIAFAVGPGISKVKVKPTEKLRTLPNEHKLGAGAGGAVLYRYAIYCTPPGDFVECNSSPVMIIEPPPPPGPPSKTTGSGIGKVDE